MTEAKYGWYQKAAFLLVLLMALLQGFYAIYAYIDPAGFSALRGTELVAGGDADWVKIYASRTLFVALIVGYLLYLRSYKILMWVSIFGIVMPIVDATLAYQAHAPMGVVLKHVATVFYLLVTFRVLQITVKERERPGDHLSG